MRFRKFALLLVMSSALSGLAQNLIPNPSFEVTSGCPPGNSGISSGYAPPWNRPPGSITTPDLFHSCGTVGTGCSNINVPGNNYAGNSAAFHGSSYAGILTYYTACTNCREYLHAPLTASLTAGTAYTLNARVKLGSFSRYATNRIGFLLSATAPTQPSNQPILITPSYEYPSVLSDKINWTLISTTYIASGGEAFITIGNFYNNASTTITDFGSSASSCALATSGDIYFFDSLFLGTVVLPEGNILAEARAADDNVRVTWSYPDAVPGSYFVIQRGAPGAVLEDIGELRPAQVNREQSFLDENPGTGTRFYRVKCIGPSGDYIYSALMQIWMEPDSRGDLDIVLFPNPASESVTVHLEMAEPTESDIVLRVFDVAWKEVMAVRHSSHGEYVAEVPLDISRLAQGGYIIEVRCNQVMHRKLLMVD